MKLEDDVLFSRFVSALNLSERTVVSYRVALGEYVKFSGKSPGELVAEAERDEERGLKMADRRIFTRLNSFRDRLRDAGLKPSSISRYVSIVKRFYKFFGVDVPSVRVGGHGRNPAFDRLPKRSEIKAAISYAKPLYKAMMLLQVSNGMGASEVSNLSLDQFVEAIGLDVFDLGVDECIDLVERENIVGVWRVRRQKTRRQYVTFSTPEANVAILEYLRERADFENWRLFAGLKTGRVGTDVYAHYLAGLNDRLGLGSFDGRRILSSHNLRRFFRNTTVQSRNGQDDDRVAAWAQSK